MFDFDKLTDRSGTLSYKWDVKKSELPMWVADMDFEVASPIKRAIVKRAEHGIFGYGIQSGGGKFVEKIEGDYDTVVGLSLALVKELLDKAEKELE